MATNLIRFALAAALATASASAAHAHRAWMLPSTFTLSGESQYVTIDGAVSNDLFFPNHVPLSLETLTVTAPDGSKAKIENASTGRFRSVFDVKLTQQGTYRISEGALGYMARWTENGAPKRQRGTLESFRAAGLVGRPGVTLTQSVRRIETFVTLGAPSVTALAPIGAGIELQPVTHPNDVVAGEAVTLRMLVDGKPAEGLDIEIVRGDDRYRDDPGGMNVVTGKDGAFTFTPEAPGRYWIATESRGSVTVDGVRMDQALSYSATIEALAP